MHEKIFVPASFFFLRIPTWPKDKFGCESSLEIYDKNEQLREAIAIASPTLYDSLKKRAVKKDKSLSHYISRMMVRPTPFGLFSSVSIAEWGEASTLYFDQQFLRKRARLDMEWVYLLIQKLYQDEKKFLSLPVRTNPLLQLSGGRYHLDYVRHADKAEKGEPSRSQSKSIRATALIQLILDHAKECIPVDELWLKLQTRLPILEQDKTLAVMHQLFSQQFLLPGLFPSLLVSAPCDTLLPHVSLFPSLKEIFEEIKKYNALPLGKGEGTLEKLQEDMAALVPNKRYLQVDTAYEGKNLELSKNVLDELEKALNLLWKIACIQKTPTILTNYLSKFLEKYGEYRTVPLLELLDAEKGLGPLFENAISPSSDQEWEKWLNQQWQDCLFNKKQEWVLTDESIDAFLKQKKIDGVDAPLSLDLLCKIFADSKENIDLGKFLLVLCDITKEGGSVFGRFLDLLGDEAQTKVAQLFALEEQLEAQSLFVELSYLPAAVRGANVTIHPCLRSHHLDIDQKGTLALEDIYVGATSSKFYLTDKKSQWNIITRANHLLKVFYDPLPFKLMRHVTRSQYTSISLFSWGSLQETAVFLPRVRYNKTILSLATWNVDPKPYLKESVEKNISSFKAWAERWDLPQSFYMVNGDQHLLLDRSNPSHLDEIVRKLKNGEPLKFVEKIEGAWIKGTEGNHYCEISVPFVKCGEFARRENSIKAAPYCTNEDRHQFPGSNWLYLKLYMGEEKINDFLLGNFYHFMEEFRQEWFIVRYQDPDSHLRLRIRSQSFEIISKILHAFEEKFRLWTHAGWLKDISIAKYERETERYGGPVLIEAAETVFYYDTMAALFILHAFSTKQMQCEEVVLYALSIVNFLRHFDLDVSQMISILNMSISDESELEGFRQCKNQLMTLITDLQQDNPSVIPEIEVMNAAFQARMESIQNFCKMGACLEKERWDSIIGDLLHMHCNRLGCLGKTETRAKLYARQALKGLLHSSPVSQ